MIPVRHVVFACIVTILAIGSAPPAFALNEDLRYRRIRTTDRRLQSLLEEGIQMSTTLRGLVERISQSDVVVYLLCDGEPHSRVAGRMTFVSSAGGLRYLVVRVAWLRSRAQQIAILAHELQHAVEVADTPAIVDGPSLAREYLRIGHVNAWSPTPGIAFDSQAAIDAGHRVLGEMTRGAAD